MKNKITGEPKAMIPSFAVFGLYLIAAGAGVSFVFQQAVNSNLRIEIGSPWWAGFISYLGGTLAMLAMVVAMREPWLTGSTVARTSWMSWTGGIFGAIYIAVSILLLPRLGAAMVVALIVVGQMLGALVFDHFGLLGVPETPASPIRIAGAILLVVGVILIRL
jgi:bacterial/archaeal transporter family-2 protein